MRLIIFRLWAWPTLVNKRKGTKMLVSFHGSHSRDFCDHASDPLRQILQSYVDVGFTHVGVTEHLPPDNDEFLYPDEIELGHDAAFLTERFARLFNEERARLKAEFREKLELFFGFETEVYGQNSCGRIEEAISMYSPDIIVASVHHVGDVPIDYSKELFEKAVSIFGCIDSLWGAYYDQQYSLIQCLGAYTNQFPIVLGHMDLIKLFSPSHTPSNIVWDKVLRNIEAAADCGILFEVNSRAFKKGLSEPYPCPKILEAISKSGGTITFGDDSHAANEVGLFLKDAQTIAYKYFNYAIVFESRNNGGYQLNKTSLSG